MQQLEEAKKDKIMQESARKKECKREKISYRVIKVIEASQKQNKVKWSKKEGEVCQKSGSHSKSMVSVC